MSETKSCFVRGVWGIYDKERNLSKWYSRRSKIDNDILLSSLNPYSPKCKVYVFGDENFKFMTDNGFDCRLIDSKPICWDMEKEQYRHKIEVWKAGLEDFDEIVFLDWDCVPVAPIPNDFWELTREGEKIKAPIYMYTRPRVSFRGKEPRKVSGSTFVYMREKETANEIIQAWEDTGRSWSEEVALSKYIDDLNGGWKGATDYKTKYEPKFQTLFNFKDKEYTKNIRMKYNIFFHLNCHYVKSLLGNLNKEGIKTRIDEFYKVALKNLVNITKLLSEN